MRRDAMQQHTLSNSPAGASYTAAILELDRAVYIWVGEAGSKQHRMGALARGQAASTLRSLICSETLRPLNRSPRGSVWLHSAWCYCPWSPSWAVQIVECLQRSTVRLSSRGWSGSCTDCWNPCDLRSHLNSLLRHRRHDVFTHLESGANASPMRLVAAAIYRAAAFFLPVITLGDLIPHIEFFCFFA